MEHPLEHPTTAPLPLQPVPSTPPVQPPLAGFELTSPPAAPRSATGRSAAARVKGRRRYWSIRDLSRRLWLGRGYDLLRDLIRSGILPATRSAHSWWIDDADVHSLRLAFDERAGKVRAFRNLDGWLRERCWVVPALSPFSPIEVAGARPSAFHWRGSTYLPREAPQTEQPFIDQVADQVAGQVDERQVDEQGSGPVADEHDATGASLAPVAVVPEASEAEIEAPAHAA